MPCGARWIDVATVDNFFVDARAFEAQLGAVTVHVFECPDCRLELCADPKCGIHPPAMWVALHAEIHHRAIEAVLLVRSVTNSG